MILHRCRDTRAINVAMRARSSAPFADDSVIVAPLRRPIDQSIQKPSYMEYVMVVVVDQVVVECQ
jgi:hypothetical protein